jgi:hypothetical protein
MKYLAGWIYGLAGAAAPFLNKSTIFSVHANRRANAEVERIPVKRGASWAYVNPGARSEL